MAIKILLLDTSAIVKFFLPERGSEIVRWMVNNRVYLGLNFSVSTVAKLELEWLVWKKAAHDQITLPTAKSIVRRSRWYFRDVFHVRDEDPIPAFRSGKPVEYKKLVKKYKLALSRNDRDVWHLVCVHNYLRCFGGESKPCVVTSDANLKKIVKAEGYVSLDPEKTTIHNLKKTWNVAP